MKTKIYITTQYLTTDTDILTRLDAGQSFNTTNHYNTTYNDEMV